ncbi:hypothetical protein HHI36_018963 [Cryptolaemus montrouzieri]|uniref:Uncharacterized protein n=1 Tax=Cryptolaemus montrouzieri TaxID=559131 RepID=A0ABD2P1K2_9CUCU
MDTIHSVTILILICFLLPVCDHLFPEKIILYENSWLLHFSKIGKISSKQNKQSKTFVVMLCMVGMAFKIIICHRISPHSKLHRPTDQLNSIQFIPPKDGVILNDLVKELKFGTFADAIPRPGAVYISKDNLYTGILSQYFHYLHEVFLTHRNLIILKNKKDGLAAVVYIRRVIYFKLEHLFERQKLPVVNSTLASSSNDVRLLPSLPICG